jgi:hypothetical protein
VARIATALAAPAGITAFAPSAPDRLRKQIDLEPCFRRASRHECAFRQLAHGSDVQLTGLPINRPRTDPASRREVSRNRDRRDFAYDRSADFEAIPFKWHLNGI